MKYKIDDTIYEVVVERKNNKNTYIRIKEPNIIFITTNYFTTKKGILSLLNNNEKALNRMHQKFSRKREKKTNFYYLGQKYDIILVPTLKKIDIIDNNIYTPSKEVLNRWLKKECVRIFKERLDFIYPRFTEDIPYPPLKIRSMKTRWGVCNRKNLSITLNQELIQYSYEYIDYVIIHELSHFVHFDHSKDFWYVVNKYCPNYKEIRKILKG